MTQDVAAFDMRPLAEIVGFIGIAFWVILGVAILVRVTVALVRRRPGDIKRGVLRPIVRAVGAQSAAYGFRPSETVDIWPVVEAQQTDRLVPDDEVSPDRHSLGSNQSSPS